ncbi:Dipeptidyl aminopeptidase [Rhodovulum sp. PH10]|nr:Dipeptidyl aminopeptidase [Rhodovulum sp. PH10]
MAAAAGSVWGLRALAHQAMLHGMRAPRVPHDCTPGDLGVPPEDFSEVSIPGPGGCRLFGWLVWPAGPRARPVPAVMVMHGWGSNAAMMLPVAGPLREAGFATLLIDARCHGRSDDEPFTSMPRFAEDIFSALSWLREQPGIDPGRLAVLGHSVGAAAALLHASRHHDVRAVISLSAFAHPREIMQRWLSAARLPPPVMWYVLRHVEHVIGASFDEIAPLTTVTKTACPVLLVHGRDDDTVPFSDAERLRDAAPHVRLMPVAGDHDLRETLAPEAPRLIGFLREACRGETRLGETRLGEARLGETRLGEARLEEARLEETRLEAGREKTSGPAEPLPHPTMVRPQGTIGASRG